ncbi:MAG: exopolysaccharide biosynthesis polyprenyl glycosylphosphotransferase [Granulosicoccus sp.]
MNNTTLTPSPSHNVEPRPPLLLPTTQELASNDSFINSTDQYASPLSKTGQFVKRTEDLILGSFALLLFLPLMLIIALAVRIDSSGPVLFKQIRTGLNRKPITVYKFRSMKHTKNQQFRQAVESDSRVTRVGAFIRRTSLDELPQLINVLNGSMSLVGPRPHPLKLDDEFKYVIRSLPSRYRMKPGITGLAQIMGFRGETRDNKSMIARINLDRKYMRNWSLAKDISILVRTVLTGWVHKNAY